MEAKGELSTTKRDVVPQQWKHWRLEESRSFKLCFPSLVMKARLLANNMGEQMALAQSQSEYQECHLMCLTDTRLDCDIPDDVTITGFKTARAHWDCTESNKW